MPNITLSVSEELHTLMKKHNELRWSEIARRALKTEAEKLEAFEKIASKSKLTMKDVMELDTKIKKSMRSHFDTLAYEGSHRH